MITEVIIVYNDSKQLDKIKGESFKTSPFFIFINEADRKSRKEAFALKSHWAARATPFIVCKEGDNVVKAFYSEADSDVVQSLVNYLNEGIYS